MITPISTGNVDGLNSSNPSNPRTPGSSLPTKSTPPSPSDRVSLSDEAKKLLAADAVASSNNPNAAPGVAVRNDNAGIRQSALAVNSYQQSQKLAENLQSSQDQYNSFQKSSNTDISK